MPGGGDGSARVFVNPLKVAAVLVLMTSALVVLAGCGNSDSGNGASSANGAGSAGDGHARTTAGDRVRTSAKPKSSTSKPSAKTVTGPATCPYKSGVTLVVNAGSISCGEAADVAANSSEPNSSTAPAGWDCSGLAKTLDGKQLITAAGKGCQRGAVTLSVYSTAMAQDPSNTVGGDAGGGASGPVRESGAFASPSYNIVCSKAGGGVQCVLGGKAPAYRLPASGRPFRASSIANKGLEPSPLAYGKSTTVAGIPCKSETAGVTCTNRGGHGFFLSRESQRLF
jgi:hypothetical protein